MIVDALTNVKLNIIDSFNKWLDKESIGYTVDYSHILNKIMFVETYQYLTNIDAIYEFVINS
jgi:hypothetical protein